MTEHTKKIERRATPGRVRGSFVPGNISLAIATSATRAPMRITITTIGLCSNEAEMQRISAAVPVDLPVGSRTELLWLLPDRAVFSDKERTLFVADVHFGKAASFRASAVAIPRGTTGHDLRRLSKLIELTGARRVVFLGDLLHARDGRAPETLAPITHWRKTHSEVAMMLVRGNHDRRAGDPPAEWDITCVDDPLEEGPFVFRHDPLPHPGGYVLSGHIHPCVQLGGQGRQRVSLPCFFLSESLAVLPAFGDFTGTARVTPGRRDRVFVIADGEVVEVTRDNSISI